VLKQEVDELVCLSVPSVFYAVGQFYRDFSQLTDREEVLTAGWGGDLRQNSFFL
jgi:putative phosphoribosyl transferase